MPGLNNFLENDDEVLKDFIQKLASFQLKYPITSVLKFLYHNNLKGIFVLQILPKNFDAEVHKFYEDILAHSFDFFKQKHNHQVNYCHQ